jgi:hypothetical protein
MSFDPHQVAALSVETNLNIINMTGAEIAHEDKDT